jgi:ApbE superfamily uncharacterized protein (UPF0280 family)
VKRVRSGKRKPESYVQRAYRTILDTGNLVSSHVQIKDTDLHILADREVSSWAAELALQYRTQIEQYIQKHADFSGALSPLSYDILAPPIVKEMLDAGFHAGVGPMAAVAGAISEYVGSGLLARGCREVMVENGGDIFLSRDHDCTVAIFAGESPLSLQVGVKLTYSTMPIAVCTSSGTVGHSLSFGLADSVTVIARSAALADAAATRLGNEVGAASGGDAGIGKALTVSRTISGVLGVVVICGEKIGAVGDVELVKIS